MKILFPFCAGRHYIQGMPTSTSLLPFILIQVTAVHYPDEFDIPKPSCDMERHE